jgi:hypothetical protein
MAKKSAIWKLNVFERVTSHAAVCSLCNESIPRKEYNTQGLINHLKNHPAQKRQYDELKKNEDEAQEIEQKKQVDAYVHAGYIGFLWSILNVLLSRRRDIIRVGATKWSSIILPKRSCRFR